MLIKMEKIKVEDGNSLILENMKLRKRIQDLNRDITTKSLRIDRLEKRLNIKR